MSGARFTRNFTVLLTGFVCGHPNVALSQTASPQEQGIPVTDPLVKSKCGGTCHTIDNSGMMQRISWERATPEAWQEALRRMILAYGVMVSPPEARSIVKYLSDKHGLAPEEARAVQYDAERRIREETNVPSENLRDACAKCHSFARTLLWRRSVDDWKQEADTHTARHKLPLNQEALSFLDKAAPLHTPEWAAWSGRQRTPNIAGRWLVTATIPGRGKYYGEMQVDPAGADDEFTTRVNLRSIRDGSTIVRSGRGLVFGGYAWRGRSKGSGDASPAPDDLSSEAREVMWIAPDQSMGEGRWFWGQYQEFGFDVAIRRPSSDATLLVLDRLSVKTGSSANRIRFIGDKIPARVKPSDLKFGPGVLVRRIVSHTANEVVAELDVAAGALPGKRDAALFRSVLPGALAIYDRIDYVKVTPDSSLAGFGSPTHPKGYQQFEAIGYQRGADGKLHTADDIPLGPVEAAWSLEVFYEVEGTNPEFVGKVSPTGFFTPASLNPNRNYDVWVIAKALTEKDKDGKPLVGKSYLVVTVPTYTFNGRMYVRDLDHWIDDGPARGNE